MYIEHQYVVAFPYNNASKHIQIFDFKHKEDGYMKPIFDSQHSKKWDKQETE